MTCEFFRRNVGRPQYRQSQSVTNVRRHIALTYGPMRSKSWEEEGIYCIQTPLQLNCLSLQAQKLTKKNMHRNSGSPSQDQHCSNPFRLLPELFPDCSKLFQKLQCWVFLYHYQDEDFLFIDLFIFGVCVHLFYSRISVGQIQIIELLLLLYVI